MDDFFNGVDPQHAVEIEQLSRLAFELRNQRVQLLAGYSADHEDALLAAIGAGDLAEHPAYEHYLSACILEEARAAVRGSLAQKLGSGEARGCLHLELAETLSQNLGEGLGSLLEIKQDALLLELDNGVTLELRYAAPDAYAFSWVWGEAMLRIDTAPGHEDLGSSHLHTAGGEVRADGVTHPGAEPMDNLRALLAALQADPLLGTVL